MIEQIYATSFIFGFMANALFLRQFLQLPHYAPKLDKLFCGVCYLPVLLYLLPLTISQYESSILGVGIAVTATGAAISALRFFQGYSPAKFALASYVIVFVPVTLSLLLPESISREYTDADFYNFSMMLQMIVIACGLRSSIDTLNKQLSQEISTRSKREDQLTEAQHIARYGDWSWNIGTQKFTISESALAILPATDREEVVDFHSIMRFAALDQRRAVKDALQKAIEDKQRFHQEFSLLFDDGITRHFSSNAEFQLNDNGKASDLLIGTIHDITDKKNADLAFTENQQRWRDLADATFEAILIYHDHIIIDANHACKALLGYGPDELIGTQGESFIDIDALTPFLDVSSDQQPETQELILQQKHRPEITVELRSRRGKFGDQQVNIVAIRDISERKRYEQQLRQLGYYDSLTGLANRSLFQQRVQHAIQRAQRSLEKHALLFIDLDQFKNINDSLGHNVGDLLLKKVATRLKQRALSLIHI